MNSKSARTVFLLGLIMLIYSCGKDIAKAVASVASNTTTAPWRITRGTIDPTISDSAKNAACVTEFGTDYVAGHSGEYTGYSANLNPPFGYGGGGLGHGLSFSVTPNTAWFSGVTTAHVFCIHK